MITVFINNINKVFLIFFYQETEHVLLIDWAYAYICLNVLF